MFLVKNAACRQNRVKRCNSWKSINKPNQSTKPINQSINQSVIGFKHEANKSRREKKKEEKALANKPYSLRSTELYTAQTRMAAARA
jgi:hypothetical protein